MKANELRIGNWVDFDKEEIAIDLEYFYWEIEGRGVLQHTKPIPLKEDWLLKFGFEDAHYGEYKKDRYTLDCEYTDKGIYYFIIDETCLELDVKHVHQLQNLYHALTGEELTIKQNDEK